MTITFRIYTAFNFIVTLIYLWFLVSALNNRAYGAALVVSEWWGWLIVSIPPLFLFVDYICERRGVRYWKYTTGILWALVWLGAMFLGGLMLVGIPWLSEGRHDLIPFLDGFLIAAVINFFVFIFRIFRRRYKIHFVKSQSQ